MNISTESRGDIVVIAVSGRMDATSVDQFNEEWARIAPTGKGFVFDLEGLEYISSAGLRCILTVGKSCMASKSRLAFCCLGSMVSDVFKLSGFNSILRILPTRDEAVAALS